MSNSLELDYRLRNAVPRTTRFLPGTLIEQIGEDAIPGPPQYALFDFDGTLSLIREGWMEVMVPLMVEVLRSTGTDETDADLTALCREFVYELTGKQTIYQMIRLAEEVTKRNGTPADPVVYKHRYHDALMQRITARREALRDGTLPPEELLVRGSVELLRGLQSRGVSLYLASGTDERYVREECDLLGLTPFFGRHIYGAQDDVRAFSKQMVIERILAENQVQGQSLIGFGDGYVEIDNVKSAGGVAVGVASDETTRSGNPDAWKRERLIGVGADFIVPDYSECEALFALLWGSKASDDAK